MIRRAAIVLLACAALIAAPAAAQQPGDEALALFAEGRFVEAAEAASQSTGAADALALAAKAWVAAGLFAETRDEAVALAAEARTSAEAALALDPAHVEGRLQLAAALWLESRPMGGLQAYRAGMPQRGRALIEGAVADAPADPWAQAMLGAWHFEAVRRGGRLASRMLDADLDEGLAAFERALALDPEDAAIAAQLGLSWLGLDPERRAPEARAAFERAMRIAPRDAFEAAMLARAEAALALMDAGDEAGLEAAVERWVAGR